MVVAAVLLAPAASASAQTSGSLIGTAPRSLSTVKSADLPFGFAYAGVAATAASSSALRGRDGTVQPRVNPPVPLNSKGYLGANLRAAYGLPADPAAGG